MFSTWNSFLVSQQNPNWLFPKQGVLYDAHLTLFPRGGGGKWPERENEIHLYPQSILEMHGAVPPFSHMTHVVLNSGKQNIFLPLCHVIGHPVNMVILVACAISSPSLFDATSDLPVGLVFLIPDSLPDTIKVQFWLSFAVFFWMEQPRVNAPGTMPLVLSVLSSVNLR
jgi:hypothetical protein